MYYTRLSYGDTERPYIRLCCTCRCRAFDIQALRAQILNSSLGRAVCRATDTINFDGCEVAKEGLSGARNENIVWFNVAMDLSKIGV